MPPPPESAHHASRGHPIVATTTSWTATPAVNRAASQRRAATPARQPSSAGGRCKGCGWAQARGWPLNCDVLPLNIKGAPRFLRKWPSATLDIEPPEALWTETKGQAASLARVRGHPCTARAVTGQIPAAAGHGAQLCSRSERHHCRVRRAFLDQSCPVCRGPGGRGGGHLRPLVPRYLRRVARATGLNPRGRLTCNGVVSEA